MRSFLVLLAFVLLMTGASLCLEYLLVKYCGYTWGWATVVRILIATSIGVLLYNRIRKKGFVLTIPARTSFVVYFVVFSAVFAIAVTKGLFFYGLFVDSKDIGPTLTIAFIIGGVIANATHDPLRRFWHRLNQKKES